MQVFDGTVAFDKDFMAFATPNPRPLPKWIALIAPFHVYVWICVVASVIIARENSYMESAIRGRGNEKQIELLRSQDFFLGLDLRGRPM